MRHLSEVHNETIICLNGIAHLPNSMDETNMANKLLSHFLGYSHDIENVFSPDNDTDDNENATI